MTKVDVLEDMESVSYADSYTVDGTLIEGIPFDLDDGRIVVNYNKVSGWSATKMGQFILIYRSLLRLSSVNYLYQFVIFLMALNAKN